MPELPEVESCKKIILDYCYNNKIINVIINELGGGPLEGKIDNIIHETPLLIYNTLINKKIEKITRKGKYIWFKMSSSSTSTLTNKTNKTIINEPKFVLFHFGMTGSFVLKNKDIPLYKSFVISSNWPPKFTKLLVTFENGEELAFCDPRRLGRIRVIEDEVESLPPISLLAKDCYTDTITSDYLYSQFQKYNVPIKPLLLDQQKVCSGIGNWIADEVLFQSHIHPSTKCNILNQTDCQRLADSINYVITTACNVQADSSKFPIEWLFHTRWEKRRASEIIRTSQGYTVKFETVGGRTSAIVPELQKLYKTRRNNEVNKDENKEDQEENTHNEEDNNNNNNNNNESDNNKVKKSKKRQLKKNQKVQEEEKEQQEQVDDEQRKRRKRRDRKG